MDNKGEGYNWFERIELRIVKRMSNATLRDKTPSTELRERLGNEDIAEVLCMG